MKYSYEGIVVNEFFLSTAIILKFMKEERAKK